MREREREKLMFESHESVAMMCLAVCVHGVMGKVGMCTQASITSGANSSPSVRSEQIKFMEALQRASFKNYFCCIDLLAKAWSVRTLRYLQQCAFKGWSQSVPWVLLK